MIDCMSILQRLRDRARRIKRDGATLWFAMRDPRTPWTAKALCAFVVAYALSPIDLVPDFIPVLGYVDDVLLLPGLIWLAVRLLPDDVIADNRAKADDWMAREGRKPVSKAGAALVVLTWLAITAAAWRWLV
jgi:uncharacterized membrane protein YkvA (DUF1232 family)